MGWALPLIAFGLTVGGSALNGINKQQYQDALNKANIDAYLASKAVRDAELKRQQTYQAEADTDMANTLTAVNAQTNATNRDAYTNDFVHDQAAMGDPALEGNLGGTQDASDAVKTVIAKQAAQGAADTRSRVKALAKFNSFGDAMQTSGLALQNNSDLLNTLAGKRRGSLAVAQQAEAIGPPQIAPGQNGLGAILSAAGGALGGMGGTPGGFGGYTVDANGQPTMNWWGMDSWLKGSGYK